MMMMRYNNFRGSSGAKKPEMSLHDNQIENKEI